MNLDDRMKAYEAATRTVLPIRMPVVIRLDGKAFHTLTRDCKKPFDEGLRKAMVEATQALLEEVPARVAYHQSDEVSLLFIDYNRFDSQQWFGGVIQKMVSIAASVMAVEFSTRWVKNGYFDARVFPVPERDIKNYFVWRQQDAMRNAISMAAQAVFSAKQLHQKHTYQMVEMLKEKGINFDEYPGWFRRGSLITRAEVMDAPVFHDEKDYLDTFLKIEEE